MDELMDDIARVVLPWAWGWREIPQCGGGAGCANAAGVLGVGVRLAGGEISDAGGTTVVPGDYRFGPVLDVRAVRKDRKEPTFPAAPMDDSDNSWCAVCDRQIVPARYIVPITNPTTNPPPSPTHDTARRSKRGGLVHGTGRVRPNGTIKGVATQPMPPVKTRVEIDQSPAPLYCSDDCRQRDLEFFHGRPVYSDSASSDTSDDQDALEFSTQEAPYQQHARKSTANTRSLAVLQREYGIPPLPPRTSQTYDEFAPRVRAAPYRPPEYTSGVMMANRRLEAVLPKALKPGERAPPLKPVPGWTDGSQAWRASTYSFAPPPRTRADILDPNRAAYQSFVASPHRSAASGVTASSASSSRSPAGLTTAGPPSPTATSPASSSLNSELLSSFEDSFKRRTNSRLSLFSPSSSPASSVSESPRKQRPLAHPAASSMLLVPDVLMRAPRSGGSCESLSTLPREQHERSARRHSAGALTPAHSFPGAAREGSSSRSRVRSPLARASLLSASSEDGEPDVEPEDAEEAAYVRALSASPVHTLSPRVALTLSQVRAQAQQGQGRAKPETRSWSYDNVRTYPVMAMPALKERRVVDGVEVEVEVERPFKRLFTFEPVPVAVS
ncbi:hypothetical protein B0H17DRAFT_1131137 [Mycena rosella]|uniref:Uncharacterized protein n=1 Tax=Mycena rosella TaxID=1033263 RepID=A0AAD7DND8_MYCRO|nr:hypothetical protein B0H17DRAFT_1131137 [Mycena rosella]